MNFFRLVHYELKKLFSSWPIKIILLLMLCLNVAFSYAQARPFIQFTPIDPMIKTIMDMKEESPALYEMQYKQVEEAFYQLSFDENPASTYVDGIFDMSLFQRVEYYSRSNEEYHAELQRLLLQTEKQMHLAPADSFAERYDRTLIEKYGELERNVQLINEPVYGWERYYYYDLEIVFVLISILAVALLVAMNDKNTGFSLILNASPNGRRQTAAAKFLVVALTSFGVVALLSASSLLTYAASLGLSNPSNAIQAICDELRGGHRYFENDLMAYCPFSMSIGEFTLYHTLVKGCAACLLGLLVFTVTLLSRRYAVGGLCGSAILLIQVGMKELPAYTIGQWKYLNIFSVFLPRQVFSRYRAVEFFGMPVDLIRVYDVFFILAIVGMLAAVLIFGQAGGVVYRRFPRFTRQNDKNPLRLFPNMKKHKRHFRSLSPVRFELMKNRVWIVFLVILIGCRWVSAKDTFAFKNNSENRIFTEYIALVGGEYSDEKALYIQTELARQVELEQIGEEMRQKSDRGEMSAEEYGAFLQENGLAKTRVTVLQKLDQQSKYLKQLYTEKGILGSYIFDAGVMRYHERGMDAIFLVMLCVWCAQSVLKEFGKTLSVGSMTSVQQSTKKGRVYLFLTKIGLSWGIMLPVYALFSALDLYYLRQNWWLPTPDAPLVSLRFFAGAPLSMSFGGYFVLTLLLGALGCLLLCLLCFSISVALREPIFVYAVMAAVLIVPNYAKSEGLLICDRLDLTNLINTSDLFSLSVTTGSGGLGYFTVFFVMGIAICSGLAFVTLKRIQRGIPG